MGSIRQTLLILINKMQQPSLPELMEFASELSHFHSEYREIAARDYYSLYYYLDSLVFRRKVLRLTANGGYRRRYCIYNNDRRFDHFVQPIPSVSFHKNNIVKLTIYSEDIIIDTKKKDSKTAFLDGRKLQIFGFRDRFFIILDYTLLGVLGRSGPKWYLRLPWRIFDWGTEWRAAFAKLRANGEKVDALGVKGKRTVCGG